jgi:hypothetical protein
MNVSEYNLLIKKKGRSKYNNKRTTYNGMTFMSKKEANFARLLDSMKMARNPKDKVQSYKTQVPMPIIINGITCFKYILDFEVLYADGRTEYIDVKGFRTSVYKLKKKCIEAQYEIEIKEV